MVFKFIANCCGEIIITVIFFVQINFSLSFPPKTLNVNINGDDIYIHGEIKIYAYIMYY